METRILLAADAAAFQALRLEGLRDSPTAFTSSYEEECDLPLSHVAAFTPGADRAVFGAFEADKLIGTVGLLRERHRKLAHNAVIWGVYVTPAFRNRGVARRLLEQALRHAGSMSGVQRVRIGVNAANASAVALYKSVGIEPLDSSAVSCPSMARCRMNSTWRYWSESGGQVANESLTFVVRVEKIGAGPSWRFDGIPRGWRVTTLDAGETPERVLHVLRSGPPLRS